MSNIIKFLKQIKLDKFILYASAGLFIWQLFHLYWLTTDVVLFRLTGQSYFWKINWLIFFTTLADYVEIPALILTSIFYFNKFRKKSGYKNLLYLIFLNLQWIHLFWITDEIILMQFTGAMPIMLPIWLSWIAIFIDYLELPVIFDTCKRVLCNFKLDLCLKNKIVFQEDNS